MRFYFSSFKCLCNQRRVTLTSSLYNVKHKQYFHSFISNVKLNDFQGPKLIVKNFSDSQNNNYESIDRASFERICNETLDSLTEKLEDLIDEKSDFGSDITFADGVLTLNLGNLGIYVINKQSPNRQIWLSSPISGPKRYDYINQIWIYKHDGVSLHKLLSEELSRLFKVDIDLTSCNHGSALD